MRLLAAVLALAGCFIDDLDLRGTMFRCDDGVTCPSGFVCNAARYCVGPVDASVDALPPACGKIELFHDNFDLGVISPIWMKTTAGAGSVVQQGGEARIVLNAMNGSGAYTSIDRADLTASQVYIDVISVANGTPQTFLRVAADADNFLEIDVTNGVLSFRQSVGGTITAVGMAVQYDNVMHRWWRIRENGMTHFETSSDGTTFMDRVQTPTPAFANDVILEFGARTTADIMSATEAHFDNLNGGLSPAGPCTRG